MYLSIFCVYIRRFLWHLFKTCSLRKGSVRPEGTFKLETSSETSSPTRSTGISKLRPRIERLPLEVISGYSTSTLVKNIEFALMSRTTTKPLLNVQTDLAGNIPSIQTDKDSIFFISTQTAAETILSTNQMNLSVIIVDCRFPYEYEGGHIINAYNCHNSEQMVKLLCPPGWETEPVADIIIFYCEYSSHRAPTMSQNLRNLDRKAHFDSYPSLSYPYLYIISKGYREFYVEFPQLCVPPGGYTPMHSKNKQNMTRKYSIQQQHSWRRNNEYSKPRSSLSLEALLSPRTQV